MSSGVEIEDGRVPLLFKGAPETSVIGAERSDVPSNSSHIGSIDYLTVCDGGRSGLEGKNPVPVEWVPHDCKQKDEPVLEVGITANRSSSIDIASSHAGEESPVSSESAGLVDVVDTIVSVGEEFPEFQEPVFGTSPHYQNGPNSRALQNNQGPSVVGLGITDDSERPLAVKLLAPQTDCFQQRGQINSRNEILGIEAAELVPEEKQKNLVVEGERSQNLCDENESDLNDVTSRMENDSRDTSKLFQLVDAEKPIVGYGHQLQQSDCDNSDCVSGRLDIGGDTVETCYRVPCNEQKGLVVEQERKQTLTTEEDNSTWTHIASPGITGASMLTPESSQLVDVVGPVIGNIEQLSLWDCDKSGAVSRILDPCLEPSILQTSSDTSRTLLIISTLHCEKKEAISKLSTIEASTCDLPNKKNALIVKVESPKTLGVEESCSLGSPGSSQLCDVTPPIVGSLQLLSMSDCDKKHCMPGLLENDEKPSIAVVGDTGTSGNHSALARSAFPGSCVPHNEQKEAADGITTIEEEQPSILYTGENTLTSVASSVFKDDDLGSPLAAHASTTISSKAPQNEAVMEFSATQEERPQASSMDKNPCNSTTITSCSVVDESTACLESLQVFDDVVGPISGFSGLSTLLACEGSGYVSGATENGSGMLEPMGPYSTTNWIQHDENEIATEFLSVEKEMLFMSVGGKHLGGSTNADFCGMVEESAACLETTQIVGVGPIAGNSKQFGGLENGRESLAMGKNNTDTVAAVLVPAVVNDVVPLKEWKEKLAEPFVTEEERPRVSEVNENICSSMEVTSCSLVQEVGAMPPISEKSTLLRSSPRLTRMRSTRTQCRKTLEGIIVSLSKSRKQRSSLCKKARSSNWGVLANIIEVFTRNEELLKVRNSHLDKASKNRSRKVRSGSGKGRKTKTTPSKGNLRLSNRKAGRSNGVSLKLNMGREARLPFLHEPVDIQTAVQAITSGCSQQLNEQVNLEIPKMNTKVEPKFSLDSLDGNSGKPILSGEISRDRDLDSTVTQDISVENTSGEFPGVSSQIEVETLTGRDFDPGTSPDSGVLHMIPDHGPFGKKCAISQIDKTDNGDSDPWTSSESGVLDKVPSLDVTRNGVFFTHKNSRRKGQIDFVLGSTVQEDNGKLAPAAYMEVHEVMPSNMRQNSRKKGKKNGKAKESTPTLFVKEQFCVVKNVKDRKYSRRKIPQEMGGVDPKESKSSGSEIFQMEPSVVETAHLRLDLQVSNLEINPGSNEFSGQDINGREYMLPKTSRTGGSKHRTRNPDSVRTSRGNTSEQKKRSAQKSVSKRKAKEKNLSGQVSNKDESHSALSGSTGVSMSDVIGKDREVAVEGVFSSEMLPVGDAQYLEPRPRAAWVSCDDCCKWRCIPAQLADEIELTNCKWTCQDNSDKQFADCSIPQEKSNADINAELEISDASGEEDSRKKDQKPKGFLPMKLLAPQVAPWTLIKHNIFLHRSRRTQTIDEIMVCHCNRSSDRNFGCGDECLNRMLNIECVKGTCPCGDLCSNQQFQKRKYAKFKWFRCGKKGYGLQLLQNVSQGQFLIEYVGEVLDLPTYEARQMDYASRGQKHFYFMTLNGSEVIDACTKGNLGRFINHSCDPNCRTEKWMVNGEVCIGLFALRDIKKGEEVTFDYNYVRVFGAAAKKCVCGSSECRGYIGGDPSNTEAIVQVDSDDEYPEPVMVPDGSKGKNIMPGIIPTQIIPTTALALRNTDPAVESLPFIPKMTLLQTEDSMGVLSSLPLENVEISSQLGQQSEVPLFIEDSTSKPSSLPQLENSLQTEDIISELEPTFKHLELSLPLTEGHSCQTSPALKTSDTSLQMESSLIKSSPVSFPVEECTREPNLTQQFDISLTREEISAKSLCTSQSVEIISLHDTASQNLSLFVGDNNKHIKIKGMGKEKPKVAKSSNHEKSSRPLNSVRKGKFSTNQVVAQKPKKQVEGTRSGRFEGVEEKLNELLDSNGGISKRKDATKGYLKLLFVTAASGDNIKGEAFQSTRDLSIVLDALLKTKSRVVLIDIISKNGLQMLHNIMKQNRRKFNKIPIIRKLLKVIEFLAAKEILTLEHINTTPPCAGMESFKESIITLTRHNDMQVHQMAWNFRDRWFPRTTRKNYSDRDDEKLDSLSAPQNHFHGSHHRWHDQGARPSNMIYDQGARTSDAIDCISQANHKPIAYTASTPTETSSLGDNNSVEGTKRRRKRKSRWDQPEETNLALIPQTLDTQILEANLDSGMGCNLKRPNTCETTRSQTSEVYSQNLSRQDEVSGPAIEDAPPGFQPLTDSQGRSDASFATCPNSAVGQPQARYIAHLPVSYGIPWDLVKEIGTIEAEGSDQWAVAPGVPFHPFPPLPPFPRGAGRPEEDTQQTGVHQTGSSVGQKDVAAIGASSAQVSKRGRCSSLDGSERRYSRQQKWDYRGDRFHPWARHRNGRGFKGSNNGNSHRGELNRVVCPEKAREEIGSGSCFKECVEGSGDKAGADHTRSTFYQQPLAQLRN